MTELAPAPPQESHHASTTSTSGISEDEARLYDRQLRLWGVEAQNRMRSSHILLCGQFRGISTEVAKNIVLAGVGRVTLLDQGEVEWEDLGSGYWLREEDIGKKVNPHLYFAKRELIFSGKYVMVVVESGMCS